MPFASRFLPWTILALLCPVAHLAELGDRAAHTTTARCARSLEALEEVYEKILEGAESCDIRGHLPTLLEYARRVTSVAELGVARGHSSVAFARAALEAAVRGERYRYRMYDIIDAPGVQRTMPFLQGCEPVEVRFRKGDVLNQSFLETIGDFEGEGEESSSFPSPDLLFIDTAHTREQLAQELEAFGPLTKSYIILHDTETFGTEDEPIHDDGTLFSHRRKQKILKNQQAYHVGKLMHSQAASSLEDLDLEHVEEALRDAQADLEQLGSGLQVAIEGWLKGPSAAGEWEVLEHSLADNGLTVLGRTSGLGANASRTCQAKLSEVRALAGPLLYLSPNFPESWHHAVFLNETHAERVEGKLRKAQRACAGHWEAKAALRRLRWHRRVRAEGASRCVEENESGDPQRCRPLLKVPHHDAATGTRPGSSSSLAQWAPHPDLFFALLPQIRRSDSTWTTLLDEAVERWPFRLESWLYLAEHRPTLQAWRRALTLCGRNRFAALQALEGLRRLNRHAEAEAWERRLVGDFKESLWDTEEFRRPSPVVHRTRHVQAQEEQRTDLERVRQLEEAQALLEHRLLENGAELQAEALRALHAMAAQHDQPITFLMNNSCHFVSNCDTFPQTCQLLEALEAHVPIISASLHVPRETVSDRERPRELWTVPGHRRLWCPLERAERAHCVWEFQEPQGSVKEMELDLKREVFLVLEIWDPAYLAGELEISAGPESLLWLQASLARLGDGGLGGRIYVGSTMKLLEVPKASSFQALHPWGDRWIKQARDSGRARTSRRCDATDLGRSGVLTARAARVLKNENDRFKARHIQINVSARGVDPTLFSVGEGTLSSETVVKLAARYPETIFLLSVFERDGVTSWPWVRQTLDLSRGARAASATHARTLQNLAAFFDDSGGLGIQPTEVPEIPVGYPRGVGQPIGFTGGIVAENVKSWLSRYEERAQEAECWCISDAQSGFRVEPPGGKELGIGRIRGCGVENSRNSYLLTSSFLFACGL
ncbi:unnamed protein product [Durusdinium trenchii]|uniref:Uncharacterized protein n=3 Tax=Durusdinium trenchii TaxID=1381693 RepID=A0ABP0P5K9_9DINO